MPQKSPDSKPKRSRMERERARVEIARLAELGLTQEEIAERLVAKGFTRVSQQQVGKDLEVIRARYLAAQIQSEAARRENFARTYSRIRGEAAKAFEDSKVRMKPVKNPDGSIEVVEVPAIPEGSFLDIAIKATDREVELLDLKPTKKVDVRQLSLNWDMIAGEIPTEVADEIEAVLEKKLPGAVKPSTVVPALPDTPSEPLPNKNALHELTPEQIAIVEGNG